MLRSDLQFRKVIFYGENNRGQDGGLEDEVLRHGGEDVEEGYKWMRMDMGER